MSKKELIYQGLENFNVIVEDKSANSPDYFRITKLPSELNAGINTLRFKGNNDVFFEGAEVLVEILDSNGDPIYYEVNLDLESKEQVAIVNIYINQDTAPGPATIFLVSTIDKTIDGKPINFNQYNIRWSSTVYIDVSKPNSEEIVFSRLPSVNITAGTGSYTNLSYSSSFRTNTETYSQTGAKKFKYLYRNGTALIVTASKSSQAFSSSVELATVTISSSYISNSIPLFQGTVSNSVFTSSLTVSGSGIIYLTNPITYGLVNSNAVFQPSSADISDFTIDYVQKSVGISNSTENTFNSVIATFYGLQPIAGTISKIRSYYRSTGVSEYIVLNDTKIDTLSDEFGFSPIAVTASFAIPTVQRNDRIDFKFEFINPAGIVSKQVVESLNNLFIGGNTYIGGDDNLLTGSLFVAGATGTGVQISGKGSAAMVRSIGYEGFSKAITNTGQAGFVLYSGSVQPLLNATEQYSGVGLEMVANSESYFKYTTSGSGLLDIRTANFFLGNGSNSISGSNGNITISGSAVSINTSTFFLGNSTTFISGSNGNILVSGSNVNILTPSFNLGTSASYVSGSDGKVEIYSSKFIVNKQGDVTASGLFVPKSFTDSVGSALLGGNIGYGNGIRPMIEDGKVWIDATNIGRCVSPADNTEYTYDISGSTKFSPVFKTVTFHTLANERLYTVAGQYRAVISGTPGDAMSAITEVVFDVYYIQSGSGTTGDDAGTYDNWTLWANNQIATQFPNAMSASATYDRVVTGKRLANFQYAIPRPISGSGGQMQLRFQFTGASVTGNDSTASLYAKYIEVMTGRDLGMNFNEYFIGSPEFSAIGASPSPAAPKP